MLDDWLDDDDIHDVLMDCYSITYVNYYNNRWKKVKCLDIMSDFKNIYCLKQS